MKPPDHPVPSGDRRVARLFMAALRAAGHDVRLASRLRTWDDASRPDRAGRLRRIGRRWAARGVARWRDAADRPDLWFTYHLYHKAPDWLGPPVCDALGIPYVVAEASYAAKQAAGPWAEGLAASAAAIARADLVLAVSEHDCAGLRRIVTDPQRLVRIPPFVDTTAFAATARARAAAQARWCDGADGPWLLAVGMMRPGDKLRSYRVLADALQRLHTLPWRLLVAGGGSASREIAAWFPAARTRFLGEVAEVDMPSVYAAADLLVWPAINEAYGMALLEGQATGLPVVAGLAGGVAEIVRDGVTGLLVPAGNAVAFADAVARLLGDAPGRAAMASAAARIASAEHGLERAAAALDAELRRVVR